MAGMISESAEIPISAEEGLANAAQRGERYYMTPIRKYLTGTLIRYGLIYFVFAFFTMNLFLIATVPFWIIVTYRYYVTVNYLHNYNFSKKFFWLILILWNILCQFGCFYLREWLSVLIFG